MGIALLYEGGQLEGVFSDGDIRRVALTMPNFLEEGVSEIMTRDPITITSGSLAGEALKILEKHSIDDLIVDRVECESGPNCPEDMNGDGMVNGADLGLLLAAWGSEAGDFNGDGTTNGADLGLMLAMFGTDC